VLNLPRAVGGLSVRDLPLVCSRTTKTYLRKRKHHETHGSRVAFLNSSCQDIVLAGCSSQEACSPAPTYRWLPLGGVGPAYGSTWLAVLNSPLPGMFVTIQCTLR
jgi:hypothetical protein